MTARILRIDLYANNGVVSTSLERLFATEAYVVPAADLAFQEQFVDGRVIQPGLMQKLMYSGGGTRGDINIASGQVLLNNGDGALDEMFSWAFDGQQFFVIEIDPDTKLADYDRAFSGYIEQPTFSLEQISFQVRDRNHYFDAPGLANRYAGTNALPAGVEGTANDIKGKAKPTVLGKVFNVSPVCVNTSKLIYQVDGQRGFVTGWAITVYDKRSTLTAGSTYTDQADMEANAPTAGQYRVWVAGGMFRLGSSPSGQITCDVTNPGSLSIGTTHCEIDALLAVVNNGLSESPECGIYLAEDVSRIAYMSELLRSVNGTLRYVGQPPKAGMTANAYMVSNLTDPASMPYTPLADVVELDESSIVSIERVVQADPERGIPVKKVNVNYAKNYTVQSPVDLAGVAQADIEFCGREYRTVTASASISSLWPLAPELTVDTLLVHEADAQDLADRLIAMHSVRRDNLKVVIPWELGRDIPSSIDSSIHSLEPQSLVRITMPRFGLDSGKLFLVLGLIENIEKDTIELTLWG